MQRFDTESRTCTARVVNLPVGQNSARIAAFAFMLLLSAALLIRPAAAQTPDSDDRQAEVIDEIVVTVHRRGERNDDPLSDPLVLRIQRELQQLRMLEDESGAASAASRAGKSVKRVRWGYEPDSHLRASTPLPTQSLPLDLMQPATVVNVGF